MTEIERVFTDHTDAIRELASISSEILKRLITLELEIEKLKKETKNA